MAFRDHACNLCGSTDARVLYPSTALFGNTIDAFSCTSRGHGKYYRVVRCLKCALVFSSPRPTAEALEQEYVQTQDRIYEQEVSGRLKTFGRNLRNLSRFFPPGRLLDIGAGMGVFVHLARKAGWDAQGIEPSSWCADKAKELFDLDVVKGTFDKAKELGGNFDVVTMWDVIEHVDDPGAALSACCSLLKPGGILALSTVDVGSLYARLMGKRWPWLMKMHIYYFDRRTMRLFLEKHGFRVLSMSVYRHTVSVRYLIYKLEAMGGLWRFLGRGLAGVPVIKDLFVTIALGDFMEVYAQRSGSEQEGIHG